MFNVSSDERGSALWLLVFVVVIIWGMYSLSQRTNLFSLEKDSGVNETTSSAIETVDVKNENSTTKSFVSVNGYDTSRGKAVISEDEFGYFTISIAVVMPSEFPGTYYEAKLTGANTTPDVNLGKMSKVGGSFTAQYVSAQPIGNYHQVIISVDGEAATVEGKTLPHGVMVLDL